MHNSPDEDTAGGRALRPSVSGALSLLVFLRERGDESRMYLQAPGGMRVHLVNIRKILLTS